MPKKANFPCPDCGAPAWVAGRGDYTHEIKCSTGRRRLRRCIECNRQMVTFQPDGQPEQFVRWRAVEASPEVEQYYARLRLALMLADAPPAFFDALARAGRRLGVRDLQAIDLDV